MIEQGTVFAQTTAAAADAVQYPFAARVDAVSGKVTPLMKDGIPASDDTAPITRGEVAALLADSLVDQSAAEQSGLVRFTDVTQGGAQADALAKLHDRGLLKGYADGSFHPDAQITRAEFCVIASALSASEPAGGALSFADVPDDYWAQEVIARMAAQGILKGSGNGLFRPEEPITHREATLILQRLSAAV